MFILYDIFNTTMCTPNELSGIKWHIISIDFVDDNRSGNSWHSIKFSDYLSSI